MRPRSRRDGSAFYHANGRPATEKFRFNHLDNDVFLVHDGKYHFNTPVCLELL
jgi:hypothetical protein